MSDSKLEQVLPFDGKSFLARWVIEAAIRMSTFEDGCSLDWHHIPAHGLNLCIPKTVGSWSIAQQQQREK